MDLRLIPAACFAWAAAWWLTRSDTSIQPRLLMFLGLTLLPIAAGLVVQTALKIPSESADVGRLRPDGSFKYDPTWQQALCAHLTLALSVALAITVTVSGYQHRAMRYSADLESGTPITLVGKVVTEPRPAPFGEQYVWMLQTAGIQFEVWGPQLPYRATVRVTGSAQSLIDDAKPIARLKSQSIAIVKEPEAWWRATNKLRQSLLQVTSGLSPQASGLVPGMAIGDTSRVSPELNTAFKVSGLAHLTAVSGGHFAVILLALGYLIGNWQLPRWARAGLFGLVSVAFVMLVRPDGAVIRAAAMCAVSVVATMLGRKAVAIPALGASILVLLSLDPWLARSFGFALSCAASGALALFSTPLARRLTPWLGNKLSYLIAVPFVAQAASAPILLLFSDGVATLTVLANVLVTPVVAPATLLSLAATLLAPWWPWAATLVAHFAGVSTAWIAWVALRLSASRLALIPVASGTHAAALLLTLVIVIGMLVWRWHPKGWPEHWKQWAANQRGATIRRLRASYRRFELGIPNRRDQCLAGTAYALALALIFGVSAGATHVIVSHTARPPNDWQVVACDVGQGDATLIRTAQHSAIVIDTGNDDGAIDRCLRQFQITTIDLLVLSHYHSDHVGGVDAALANRQVGSVIGPDSCGGEANQVATAVAAAHGELQQLAHEYHSQTGPVTWQILPSASTVYPNCNRTSSDDDPDLNDQSLVFIGKVGAGSDAITIVALGDLETEGQNRLLSQLAGCHQLGEIPVARADIVKVAHHGSAKQSSGLARCLQPKAAVFSVGAGNTYGHPTAKALELYAGVGAYEVRTDECGHAAFTKRHGDLTLTCLGSD